MPADSEGRKPLWVPAGLYARYMAQVMAKSERQDGRAVYLHEIAFDAIEALEREQRGEGK